MDLNREQIEKLQRGNNQLVLTLVFLLAVLTITFCVMLLMRIEKYKYTSADMIYSYDRGYNTCKEEQENSSDTLYREYIVNNLSQ